MTVGPLVTCSTCRRFEVRAGQAPDGWCSRHHVATFSAVPFQCATFEASGLEARRAFVEWRLAEEPGQRIAVHVAEASLRPATGAPMSLMLAARTRAGILSAELLAPRERFDSAALVELLEGIGP